MRIASFMGAAHNNGVCIVDPRGSCNIEGICSLEVISVGYDKVWSGRNRMFHDCVLSEGCIRKKTAFTQ